MTDANGLCYMRARYYNPEIRRFVNQDVLLGSIDNSQSLNRFAYVNGEPVSNIDPFGLWSIKSAVSKGKATLSRATKAVKTTVSKAANTVKRGATQAAKTVKGAVSRTVKTVSSVGGKIVNTLNKTAASVVQKLPTPRMPDYAALNFTASVPATRLFWSGTIEEDRYGNWFGSVGRGGGAKSNKITSISGSVGWVDTSRLNQNNLLSNGQPTEKYMKEFLKGWSLNKNFAIGIGGGKTTTSVGKANEFMVSSPTWGGSGSYGIFLGNDRKWLKEKLNHCF